MQQRVVDVYLQLTCGHQTDEDGLNIIRFESLYTLSCAHCCLWSCDSHCDVTV